MEIQDPKYLVLNTPPQRTDGLCVVYVMSRDQRVQSNPALYKAQQMALRLQLPLVVVFCLYNGSGHRSREHYEFMLNGLKEVEADLRDLHIGFMMVIGDPKVVLMNTFIHLKPSAVIFDFSPLSGPRVLQKFLAKDAVFECLVVDAHNVVPVWVASQKLEVGARTLRPKIHRLLAAYSTNVTYDLRQQKLWPEHIMSVAELDDKIAEVLVKIPSNYQTLTYVSGERAACLAVNEFVENRFAGYATNRNDPTKDGLSGLSLYLHYGQLSALQVLSRVQQALNFDSTLQASYDVLVEEMVVRKELSDNYCLYSTSYRTLTGAPNWAQLTLKKHETDIREFLYTRVAFEHASTHDTAWNAAQIQLLKTGKMHGYMRMYWAKKVLEWSASPQEAIDTLIYLNDFYSIDGGDPNGYTGIMWSVAGVHDRPWGERPVYGVIRCMVYTGLKRKFDIVTYENRWLSMNEHK